MAQSDTLEALIDYLKAHRLMLATAESCTAGKIVELLARVPGCGACLDAGYVVYSEDAKRRVLGVSAHCIETFGLTSEQVAREMVQGALRGGQANVAVATTGIAGPESMDGVRPGTLCFAWGFATGYGSRLFSRTQWFAGERKQVIDAAAWHALRQIPLFHEKFRRGEGG
ncbi:MAG: CinA family protein [Pseudomonas sp.]|uniref:CinA family protein n=1 Tax=Pseudomonas sp. TaxID=306 RepID=UPI003391CE48